MIDKKDALTHDEMLALLHGRLVLSRFVVKLAAILSGNRRRASKTTLLADGITAETFSRTLDALMLVPTKEYRRVNLSANLEHYILDTVDGTLEVVETTGNSLRCVRCFSFAPIKSIWRLNSQIGPGGLSGTMSAIFHQKHPDKYNNIHHQHCCHAAGNPIDIQDGKCLHRERNKA